MLGELGVVFLMFHLGMEFDLARLRKLLMPSVLAVVLQTAGMLFLGFQVAPLLGLDGLHGFFLGSLLAISSSMVTVRVLEQAGQVKLPEGQLVVGILILEDILAVLLLTVGIAVIVLDIPTYPWLRSLPQQYKNAFIAITDLDDFTDLRYIYRYIKFFDLLSK